MKWLLKHTLRSVGHQADPDPKFVRQLESQFRQQTGHPIWWIQWTKAAVVACTVLAFAGSGTGAYAYSSDDVLEDHPLFGLRTAMERMEMRTAFTAERRAEKLKKIEARRARVKVRMEERRAKRFTKKTQMVSERSRPSR